MSVKRALRGGVFPVWNDSRRADTKAAPQPVPVAKRAAVRLYHQAREIERRTRAPGRQDGKITRNGLAVLHALVFDFCNWRSGACDPTYTQIAEKAAISPRSVARGLVALKAAGLLAWIRRCVEATDKFGRFCLNQISNLYALIVRSADAPVPLPGTWGDHPNDGDCLGAAVAALGAGVRGADVLYTLEAEPGLGAALASIGRQNFPRLL